MLDGALRQMVRRSKVEGAKSGLHHNAAVVAFLGSPTEGEDGVGSTNEKDLMYNTTRYCAVKYKYKYTRTLFRWSAGLAA